MRLWTAIETSIAKGDRVHLSVEGDYNFLVIYRDGKEKHLRHETLEGLGALLDAYNDTTIASALPSLPPLPPLPRL